MQEKAPSQVRAHLAGIKLILVAAPGVLFQQRTAEEMEVWCALHWAG